MTFLERGNFHHCYRSQYLIWYSLIFVLTPATFSSILWPSMFGHYELHVDWSGICPSLCLLGYISIFTGRIWGTLFMKYFWSLRSLYCLHWLIMSMGWDISEPRPPMGLLFIPRVICERGEQTVLPYSVLYNFTRNHRCMYTGLFLLVVHNGISTSAFPSQDTQT
jgi:hypothetical protein